MGNDMEANHDLHDEPKDPDTLRELLPSAIQGELAKLTTKQRDFAVLTSHGVDREEAYRQVYDVGEDTKDTTVTALSYKVAGHPKVRAVVELIQSRALTAGAAPEEVPLTRAWVLRRLGEEVENAKNGGSTRVRALELIGKAQGMFEEVQVIRDERPTTAEEAERLIMALIGEVVTGRKALVPPKGAIPAETGGETQVDSDTER